MKRFLFILIFANVAVALLAQTDFFPTQRRLLLQIHDGSDTPPQTQNIVVSH
jgi:hypothetical protein